MPTLLSPAASTCGCRCSARPRGSVRWRALWPPAGCWWRSSWRSVLVAAGVAGAGRRRREVVVAVAALLLVAVTARRRRRAPGGPDRAQPRGRPRRRRRRRHCGRHGRLRPARRLRWPAVVRGRPGGLAAHRASGHRSGSHPRPGRSGAGPGRRRRHAGAARRDGAAARSAAVGRRPRPGCAAPAERRRRGPRAARPVVACCRRGPPGTPRLGGAPARRPAGPGASTGRR